MSYPKDDVGLQVYRLPDNISGFINFKQSEIAAANNIE